MLLSKTEPSDLQNRILNPAQLTVPGAPTLTPCKGYEFVLVMPTIFCLIHWEQELTGLEISCVMGRVAVSRLDRVEASGQMYSPSPWPDPKTLVGFGVMDCLAIYRQIKILPLSPARETSQGTLGPCLRVFSFV